MEILQLINTKTNPNTGKQLKIMTAFYEVTCDKCSDTLIVTKQQAKMDKYIPVCKICKLSPIACDTKLKLIRDLGMVYRTESSTQKTRMAKWKCICDNEFIAGVNGVSTGNTTSCGCEQKRLTSQASITHGMTNSSEYGTWSELKGRCERTTHKDYDNYGARGITVCTEWSNSFELFYEDMGARPKGLELDRIDNNGNYIKSNCRWAKRNTQCRNSRRQTGITGFRGVDLSGSKFRARITVDYKRIDLGSFTTAQGAALAYNIYVIENKLEHLLNEFN